MVCSLSYPELLVSNRLKELLGLYPADRLTLEKFNLRVAAEHRKRINAGVEQATMTAGPMTNPTPLLGFMIKTAPGASLGNTFEQSGCLAFNGIIMDITDLKADEQRKNDFISMVSHELKSPLTSLSGYTQILASGKIHLNSVNLYRRSGQRID